MILDVSRSHIKVEMGGKTVTVPGEMFFPPSGKLGFAVSLNGIKYWDAPNQDVEITKDELDAIIEDIKTDFARGGHTLEVE